MVDWEDMETQADGLLELVGTVTVPAIETFRAKEHFKDDRSGPVVIGYISDNFRKVFLTGDGLVEGAVAEATLRIHRLMKASMDASIIAELGEAAETTLGQMYEMMKAQGQGQQGNLLINGYANALYVRNAKSTLLAAYCRRDSLHGYWYVGADSVTDLRSTWRVGDQVFSR